LPDRHRGDGAAEHDQHDHEHQADGGEIHGRSAKVVRSGQRQQTGDAPPLLWPVI
jgi:hypothetical protein